MTFDIDIFTSQSPTAMVYENAQLFGVTPEPGEHDPDDGRPRVQGGAELSGGQATRDEAMHEIEQMNRLAATSPVKLADLDSVPRHAKPLLAQMDLDGLRDALLKISPCAERMTPHPELDGARLLRLADTEHPITFDPAQAQDEPSLSLLTWGNPLLNRLLESAENLS